MEKLVKWFKENEIAIASYAVLAFAFCFAVDAVRGEGAQMLIDLVAMSVFSLTLTGSFNIIEGIKTAYYNIFK